MKSGEGLELNGLRRNIGAFEIRADFKVGSSERLAIVARSGSGKTTLLRMIAGLEESDSGEHLLNGRDLKRLPPEKREIGFVFQDQALFPQLDVLENAGFGLMMRGVSRKARDAEVMPWLERVGMLRQAATPVSHLSGGERQRLAFVRAWVWKPKALLLDEPFSALDAELRSVLRRELVELHALWPVPLLWVTHDVADLDQVATGRIVLNETEHPQVRSFTRESR